MNVRTKTVVLLIGLPYTGKTTLIQHLLQEYGGEAIHADAIFTSIIPPSQINLDRWLQEGDRLIEHIQSTIQQSPSELFFVELGTMRAQPRRKLIHWCDEQGYTVIPLWCRCQDEAILQKRHQSRVAEIGKGVARGAKIDIRLDDLYARICAAFEKPTAEEGFIELDTSGCLDDSLEQLRRHLAGFRQ